MVFSNFEGNLTTGSATVTLTLTTLSAITPGTATAMAVTTAGQVTQETFSAVAGQSAAVQITNFNFNVACGNVIVSVLSPSGSTLASGNACGTVFQTPVSLPATGIYVLQIAAQNSGIGNATVTLSISPSTEPTGSITPGTPTQVTISTAGQSQSLTFIGTTGQSASVQVTNANWGCCEAVTVLNPDGTTLMSNYNGGGSLNLGPIPLQATGTYTLVFSSYNGNLTTGSATVTLGLSNNVVGGTIASGTPVQVTIGTLGQSESLTFTGTTGQSASVQVTNANWGCCEAVTVLNPDGTTLMSNYNGGGSLNLGPIPLQATGTYTLVFSSYNGNLTTGSATVTLGLSNNIVGPTITSGTPVLVTIGTLGQSESLTFTGTVGQSASVQLSGVTWGCCEAVTVLNPDGTTLMSNYSNGGSISLGPVALPATGTYTLVFSSYNGNLTTGSATVTLGLSSEIVGPTITSGTPVLVTIGTLGQSESLTFTGTVGQSASVQLSGVTWGCCEAVTVLNPDGTTLMSNYSNGGSISLGPVALPATGTYTLVFSSYNGNLTTGSATVTLGLSSEIVGSTITSGTPTTVIIGALGQSESLTFTGTVGQSASVQVSGVTWGCCEAVTVVNPDGTTLIWNYSSGGSLSLGPIPLPATGTYTLVFSSYNGNLTTGSATVTAWIFNEQTGFILPEIPATVTINIPGQSDSLTFNGTAGQSASVQLVNNTFGNYEAVSIVNPDGTTLTSGYTGGGSFSIGPITLPVTGAYTLVFAPYQGNLTIGNTKATLNLQ